MILQCHTNLAACLLNPNIERHPEKTSYLCNDETVTYRQRADGEQSNQTGLREKCHGQN